MQNLRLLLWLKWKLTLRGFQRNSAQGIGAALMLFIFLPASIAIGALCYLGFISPMSPANQTHLLYMAFLAIYVLWLAAPLLGYAFNDSYDITRLFYYPVPMRQIFLAVVCGSLFDLPTLFLLPTLLAAFLGFTVSLGGAVLNVIALTLFLIHTFALSQATILIGSRILRSRKFRDGMMLLISLAAMLYFVSPLLLAGHGGIQWRGLLETQGWQIVNYFPQGLAARALEAARRGKLDDALAYNFLLALITAGTLALASFVLQRVYTEGGSDASPQKARRKEKSTLAETEGFSLFRGLPPPMRALVEKEFAYIRRDLYFRSMLIQFASFIVLGVSLGRGARQLPPEDGAMASLSGIGLMLTPAVRLVCNVFGTEGSAITLLFLTPCARRYMLLAKNLTWFLTLGLINSLYALLVAAVSGQWLNLPLGCIGSLISLVVFLALGNFASIYAPYRLVMNGWRVRQASASKGFAYTLMNFATMLIALVLLLPVAAAFFLPIYYQRPEWIAPCIPLSALYAGALYVGSVFGATRLLPEREERISAAVALTEE